MTTPSGNRDDIVDLDLLGPGAVPDHVGMVVDSIARVSPESRIVFDPKQKVRVAFVSLNGMLVELVEPVGDDSPVANSLKRGSKLLHICYRVPDLSAAIASAEQRGFFCLASPEPAVAFDGRRIAWVYSRTYGLLELLETATDGQTAPTDHSPTA